MRNPFARLASRSPEKLTLRERLAATKEKYGRSLRVHRALNAPPVAEPTVDRVALVNYASWLYMERRLVCQELYPHKGVGADRFVLSANAAEQFHYPTSGRFPDLPTRPDKASSRAVRVLDMVGVDWRADLSDREHLDPASDRDNGTRPALPYGWPSVDAALVTACGDLQRIDAATSVLLRGDPRDAMDVPGYAGLDEERGEVLSILTRERSESLAGLQAKAKAMLTLEDYEGIGDFARSIAADLLGARRNILEPTPDPILPMIEEGRRLLRATEAAFSIPQDPATLDPPVEQGEAYAALWSHIDNTILKTAPRTAAGCRELARFAVDYADSQGVPISDDEQAVTSLIAQSPLL